MSLRLSWRLLVLLLLAGPAAAQLTVTRGDDMSVDVSSDGRLAIDLQGDIWIVPGSGGDARQVTNNLMSAKRPRWSPDGKRLVFQAFAQGRRGLWIYDLESDRMVSLGNGHGFDLYPEWHPNGNTIVYSSDTDGHGFDLWEIDIPTGLQWRLNALQGDDTEPAWSSDGRDLVYINRNGNLWSLILRRHSQAEEILVRSNDELSAPAWRPDGSLITYFRDGSGGLSMDMVILSRPRLVRRYATNEQFVRSPVSWLDRQRMVYSANGEIRRRQFDSWRSRPVRFRATLAAPEKSPQHRVRQALPWLDEPSGQLVIHAARLFDGLGTVYRHNQDIVINGGRIVAVEAHAERPGSIVIDMGDLAVLPGFIDTDALLPGELSASHGPDLLTSGVTTMVASHKDAEQLNQLWSGKEVPGPRMLPARQWQVAATARPELDVTAAIVTSRSTGFAAGESLAAEFRSLEITGLTPAQGLRAVGVNAAAAMLADPYLGRIAVGAAADLVFVDGDPLSNLSDALNVVAVVRNGRFYSVSGLVDRARRAETVE